MASRADTAQPWLTVIKNALLRRLSAEQLVVPLKALQQRHRANPKDVARILLSFRATHGSVDDPLLFAYADLLLKTHCIAPSHLLLALLRSSRYANPSSDKRLAHSQTALPSCEERIFTLVVQFYLAPDTLIRAESAHSLIFAITSWLRAVSGYELARQLEGSGIQAVDVSLCGTYEALGALAITVLANPGLRDLVDLPWWKQRRAAVIAEMENFDTNILQWLQSQFTGRLQTLARAPPFNAVDDRGRPIFTDQQILDSIPEVPAVASRAGLFIWLNAALIAQPRADDMMLLGYLHARHPGDTQSAILSLLMAAFDVLTNAMLRQEPRQSVKIIKSFICNKVPLILVILAGTMVPPANIESCVQMAMMPDGMVSMDPLISDGDTHSNKGNSEFLKGTRLDFLQACALHGLITENGIAAILQESIALPRIPKHNKDALLELCHNNAGALEGLIDDLAAMQGNAAAITGCIIDTVANLCATKDTMSLKAVCNELVKKLSHLDIAMQYTSPSALLAPLCSILNEWVHDQDQTEFTPAYEEFASILLLVLATRYRYDLSRSELGVAPESFMGQLHDSMYNSHAPADLPEDQASRLAKWIEGLFAVDEDGGTGGISDEVMRNCSPQSFYLLVPTLLEQSIMACSCNALPMATLRSGLELLLEPFLLPSLIMGLGWLAQYAWQEHGDADILLQVSEKLLQPSSGSQESRVMHNAVLPIIAEPLHEWLQKSTLFKKPRKALAAGLADKLKPHVDQRRTTRCTRIELATWMPQGRDIVSYLRNQIRELAQWAGATSTPRNPPPQYTAREVAVACQLRGTPEVLDGILAELDPSKSFADMPLLFDVCSAIICAPLPSTRPLLPDASILAPPSGASPAASVASSQRECLRLRATDIQTLLDRPQAEAEAIVNLYRRVEAQLAVLPPSSSAAAATLATIDPTLPATAAAIASIQDHHATDQIMQDLGLDLGVPATSTSTNPNTLTGAALNSVRSTHPNPNASATDPLAQHLDLTTASADELANLSDAATNAAGMLNLDLDQAQIFADINLGNMASGGVNPATANVGGTVPDDADAVMGDLPSQEEDIFAGLDMEMGDLGDDLILY